MKSFDLCVIGGGPGGYVAAIRAGQRGLSVALIEKQHLGGVCLNVGCIPTKTLISGADVYEKALKAAEFGVDISGTVTPNWLKMLERKDDVIGKLRGGVASLLKAAGVTVFSGVATFLGRKEVMVLSGKDAGEKITAKNIIIATGSESLFPSFIPTGPRVLTSTGLLEIKEIPKTLLVLGGGVIGCEFASLFAALGTKVTVVEMLPTILPLIDREVTRLLTNKVKDAGVTIMTGEAMGNIKTTKTGVSGQVGETTLEAD
ncbi:MAG: FAD-dependent oxidoreductase, partial [Victivallaceae bacterium]|nr:FAD-dependent oxidoreductase [Victivallaceae bacterium]